jgi:hypothetical protein
VGTVHCCTRHVQIFSQIFNACCAHQKTGTVACGLFSGFCFSLFAETVFEYMIKKDGSPRANFVSAHVNMDVYAIVHHMCTCMVL